MEGLEHGYDSYSSVRSPGRNSDDVSSSRGNAEASRFKAERKAEKRKRKAERAARRAEKAALRAQKVREEDDEDGVAGAVTLEGREADSDGTDAPAASQGALAGTSPAVSPAVEEVGNGLKPKEGKKKMKVKDAETLAEAQEVSTDNEAAREQPAAPASDAIEKGGEKKKKSTQEKRKARNADNVGSADEQPKKKKQRQSEVVEANGHADHGPANTSTNPSPATAGPSRVVPSSAAAAGPSGNPRQRAGSAADMFTSKPKTRKSRPSATGSTDGAKSKETDEELRRLFKNEAAMHAWLSEQWRDLKELARLESLGILKYRRGRFSREEREALKGHFETFKQVNQLDGPELVNIIMGKGRSSVRKDYPRFWPEAAAQVPGRPVKSVKDFVKREFDPRGYKGAWTPAEDKELIRAYNVHPNQWTQIASIVDRTEQDCRDRYRNELMHKDTRVQGQWDAAESQKLIDTVRRLNTEVGNDPEGYEAPWDLVVEAMGGTRTRTQCRKKWQDQLRAVALSKGERTNFSPGDRPALIRQLKRLHVESEADVDWKALASDRWPNLPPPTLRNTFYRMKKSIPDEGDMAFEDLLDLLAAKYGDQGKKEKGKDSRRIVSNPTIVSDDEGSNQYESEEKEESAEVDAEV